jgi:DNA-binding transcriptional MerR regulator
VVARKQSDEAPPELSLAELAAESGVPERTIRFYISRGILDGPARGGRGAFYTTEHRKRIEEIRRKQAVGLTLSQIERETGEQASPQLPQPEGIWVYQVAPDVSVHVRSGLSPWRTRQVKSALTKLSGYLQLEDAEQEDGEKP